jgi:enoyl-CoA hydratase
MTSGPAGAMDSPLAYELADGLATITLDDGKANVMSVAMLQAVNAALDRAEADQAAVLLTGRPGMFSGGFDLAVFKRLPAEQLQMLELGARLTERLLSFPRPVVAACTGHAIAMGAFLLLCCDLRIGVDAGARIQVNEVQIGLTLPGFAVEVCRQRLTPAALNLAALTAQPHTPVQALAGGFLDEIAAAPALAAAARERASGLAKLPAAAFAATKLRLRRTALDALRTAIDEDVAAWNARLGGQ